MGEWKDQTEVLKDHSLNVETGMKGSQSGSRKSGTKVRDAGSREGRAARLRWCRWRWEERVRLLSEVDQIALADGLDVGGEGRILRLGLEPMGGLWFHFLQWKRGRGGEDVLGSGRKRSLESYLRNVGAWGHGK